MSSIHGGPAALDVTTIAQSGYDRLGGVRTGEIAFTAVFDDAAGSGHPALSTLPTTDVGAMYLRGTTLGNPAAAMIAKQVNYDGARSQDGMLTFGVQALNTGGYGLDWGKSLTAGIRTDTTATNGTGVDFGTGSTTFGARLYLQSFALTGTSCTVTVQESSNDGGGDAYAPVTGGAFAAFTGRGSQLLATSTTQTVERYLRAASTGTFTNAQFAIVAVRNDTAVT